MKSFGKTGKKSAGVKEERVFFKRLSLLYPRIKLIPFLTVLLFLPAPSLAAERILVLGAPAVEMVCALGLGDKIIARAAWDLWPPAVRGLPQVGEPDSPNMELILHLKPDLVVADMHFNALAGRMHNRGIKTITISAYNTHEVIPALGRLAEELGIKERGRELEAELMAMLKLTADRLKDIPRQNRPQVLALTGISTYYSFSGKSGWSFLDYSGGLNMCADWEQPFPVIAREWLAVAKPDFVMISPYRTDYDEATRAEILQKTWVELSRHGVLTLVQAVREGRLIVIDDLLTFGLRSIPGSLYMAKKLHPALFEDIDAGKIHADFLLKYFDYKTQGGHIYP